VPDYPQFLPEVWALYGLGMTVLILRCAVRLQTVGFRGLKGDDVFSLLVMAFYTMDAATVHIVCECIRTKPSQAKPKLD
jgi:hypothetical protein